MNAPIDITAHFSMDMYLETCAFVPFLPSLSLWRRRFSRFFSPRFLRFSTYRIADRNLNFLETFWKPFAQLCFLFRKFPSMKRMLTPLSIWRSILDSDRSIYIFNYFFWVYNSIVEIGMKRKTFSAISTPFDFVRFVVRCPLTEPRISICAHEIDIETFTLATRPDSYNIFSRRGTEADLHLTARRPDRVATSILASLPIL